MIISDCFKIVGKKTYICRQEGEVWIIFDPYDLEYYQLNTTAADILYLSYNVKMLENQYKLFNEKYDSTKEEFIEYKNTVLNFEFIIKNFAINNIINGDYNNV